jgi:hypothetical protein
MKGTIILENMYPLCGNHAFRGRFNIQPAAGSGLMRKTVHGGVVMSTCGVWEALFSGSFSDGKIALEDHVALYFNAFCGQAFQCYRHPSRQDQT